MNNGKNTTLALFLVIILGAFIYFFWRAVMSRVETGDGVGTVCTSDAMRCPNGSWVGRSGPDCQFDCPASGTSTESGKSEASLFVAIGEAKGSLGVTIAPIEILEDSRCPSNVQCIQAGTVRVRAMVVSGLGTSTPIFILDKPITTEAETITLVSVSPLKEAGKAIAKGDYRFTFKVAKR